MNKDLYIVKIGGKVINDTGKLKEALDGFKQLPFPKILVHGGGKKADELLEKVGIEPVMIDGRRITDNISLDFIVMVYAGSLNKNIVAMLQAEGVNSVGLSGADFNLIEAVKRPVKSIDYGFAGDVIRVNSEALLPFLEGCVPVICPVTHDKNGQLLNTNADTIASEIAASFSGKFQVHLIFGFEKKGVLHTPDSEDNFYSHLDIHSFQSGKEEGKFSDGILPKLDNAFKSIKNGVKQVVICRSDKIGQYGSPDFQGTIISE